MNVGFPAVFIQLIIHDLPNDGDDDNCGNVFWQKIDSVDKPRSSHKIVACFQITLTHSLSFLKSSYISYLYITRTHLLIPSIRETDERSLYGSCLKEQKSF